MSRAMSSTIRQRTIFPRGGARRGSGRKRREGFRLVAHAARERVAAHDPVLVTTHLVEGCPSLRRESTLTLLRRVLAAGSERFGFRLVEYSIQDNHLHLIAEGEDARSVARGMQGLLVRVAKALNRAWKRRGKVLRDRDHARVLRSAREVRNALVYVLHNARKHGARVAGVDAYSSGAWFRGFSDRVAGAGRPIAEARSWRLRIGWKLEGPIATTDAPKRRPGASFVSKHRPPEGDEPWAWHDCPA